MHEKEYEMLIPNIEKPIDGRKCSNVYLRLLEIMESENIGSTEKMEKMMLTTHCDFCCDLKPLRDSLIDDVGEDRFLRVLHHECDAHDEEIVREVLQDHRLETKSSLEHALPWSDWMRYQMTAQFQNGLKIAAVTTLGVLACRSMKSRWISIRSFHKQTIKRLFKHPPRHNHGV